MNRAELAWRRVLAEQSIADVLSDADGHAPGFAGAVRASFARS